jgi:hypothetical protein
MHPYGIMAIEAANPQFDKRMVEPSRITDQNAADEARRRLDQALPATMAADAIVTGAKSNAEALLRRAADACKKASNILTNGILPGAVAEKVVEGVIRGNDRNLDNDVGGVFVTIRHIRERTEGPVESVGLVPQESPEMYPDYGEYLKVEVRKLMNTRTSYQSPVGILGERDNPDGLAHEAKRVGREVLEERLASGLLVLFRFEQGGEAVLQRPDYRGMFEIPSVHSFDRIPPQNIEAVFVPGDMYDAVRANVPRDMREKVKRVTGKVEYASTMIKGPEQPHLEIPDWESALVNHLRERMGAAQKGLVRRAFESVGSLLGIKPPRQQEGDVTYGLYGARVVTPTEAKDRID